jgi:ATP-dependent exoDNAse (exonuclease V) beta subunit
MLLDLRQLVADPPPSPAMTQALLDRVRDHLLTQDGEPRKRLLYKKADFRSPRDYERHVAMVGALGPYLVDALHGYRQDINLVLARAVRRLFAVALEQYQRTLGKYGVLDFSDVLHRTLGLLARMDEFSRSRFKLEARYQHVLVDEFQDTSRAQWELVELLIRSWASGRGLTARELEPSIFIVGDRKQSIYGFRDAEVAVLDEAARYIEALRPIGQVRTAISRSFRSVVEILAFVNDVFAAIDKVPDRPDAFRYEDADMFPIASTDASESDALGIVAAATDEQQATAVADEIAVLLSTGATVRDRDTGVRRAIRPGDIAVLFRTRDGHQVFERVLAERRVPYYVYKGLGFFDADEIKDVLALVTFLARPQSPLSAAALLRSRVVRLSDEALKRLAPRLAEAIVDPDLPSAFDELSPYDQRRLSLARRHVPGWLRLVDRLPPSELVDRILADVAYAAETAGPAYRQARENLKKIRALVRRLQNRGYATLGRIVDHFDRLVAGGDESSAIVDAIDAVNLMTAHAAKGLEFPVVFLVHLQRGSGGSLDPMRVVPAPFGRDEIEPSVAIGDHESDADRDLAAREAEEGKRLLYVALTRARDRVYLAGTLSADGRFVAGAGGLGRTLPPSLSSRFVDAAAADAAVVAWPGATRVHQLRVIRPAASPAAVFTSEREQSARADTFDALEASGPRRVAVTDLAEDSAPPADAEAFIGGATASPGSTILLGSFVHRALERDLLRLEPEARLTALEQLLQPAEQAVLEDVAAFVRSAAAMLERLRAHPTIAEVFLGAVEWRRHEVPISLQGPDGRIVRGTIDCVAKRATGAIDVLEIKTGRPEVFHGVQLDRYVEAMRGLEPATIVEGHLVYADEPPQLSAEPGV